MVLHKFGFNDHWCNLIMECVSSSSMRILFNGEPLPVFCPSHSLYQRDLLSPYLFILISECLSILIDDAYSKRRFKDIQIVRDAPWVMHNLFAVGTLFFINATLEHYQGLKDVLNSYCLASGQVINFKKNWFGL